MQTLRSVFSGPNIGRSTITSAVPEDRRNKIYTYNAACLALPKIFVVSGPTKLIALNKHVGQQQSNVRLPPLTI